MNEFKDSKVLICIIILNLHFVVIGELAAGRLLTSLAIIIGLVYTELHANR